MVTTLQEKLAKLTPAPPLVSVRRQRRADRYDCSDDLTHGVRDPVGARSPLEGVPLPAVQAGGQAQNRKVRPDA